MRILLTVPGEPMGKARARIMKTGGAFTPQKTVNYETLIRELFILKHPDFEPFAGPLRLELVAFMKIPKKSKTKMAAMERGDIRPTKKPDMSNILKIVEDALETVAYLNDKQIVSLLLDKKYSSRPRIELAIEEL